LLLVVVNKPLDLRTLSVRDHTVFHRVLHNLCSLEHGKHRDFLASDRVVHEALEDRKLVQHVEHEEVHESVNCSQRSAYLQIEGGLIEPV